MRNAWLKTKIDFPNEHIPQTVMIMMNMKTLELKFMKRIIMLKNLFFNSDQGVNLQLDFKLSIIMTTMRILKIIFCII